MSFVSEMYFFDIGESFLPVDTRMGPVSCGSSIAPSLDFRWIRTCVEWCVPDDSAIVMLISMSSA
jgi:hypothetical protein